MPADSVNLSSASAKSNTQSSCGEKTRAKDIKLRYELASIPFFDYIISGNEPSIQPGTASAWIEIQNGGSSLSTTLFIGMSDTITVNPECLQGICTCRHYVGVCLAQLKPCYSASQFIGRLEDMSEADVYVLYFFFKFFYYF